MADFGRKQRTYVNNCGTWANTSARPRDPELYSGDHAAESELGAGRRGDRSFFNYHAVPGNRRALDTFRTQVNRAWLRALRRRSQKGRKLNWGRMKRLIATWIPTAKVLHPYPNQRLTL